MKKYIFQLNIKFFHIDSPSLNTVSEKYVNAYKAGKFGVNCVQSFSNCPPDWNLLESISKYF